ncbi:PDZ domain and Sterile alpha motif domain and Ankyrin repeat and Sterile alpha motif/pointed domain and Ankyrin repeat-containing domain and Sterile alpha motif, type 1 domain-containing protein [Strongyloides ratti]|uniref:PDZ domain and Sterile alpha motif domain and Ankyrin repeat and Sterile alpha motif/pointed domain and Ankyrin repeat-containing domain and Sterile alpha motif, type 1 domain-containing protein n=1 Tax=Strongyloides ratti TaxID=34506 RepID=A0A090N0R2_STRRB|nr:PDZ domain and Sterile alpha motif domain and Ankyrin repeat and Sterile alpha motif/pointed domain and Ankyrin repeat-containing domain and Sterile alpha motif, type 1 domain-containing protein [Strongyloides ratti]CEF71133.1 PDZ domain and Sterile alpha motif domain and Ankyrin repeat and Sterile alpha motif/pointed domain and Ankyrin repeat-containing domain and Sterile alpha motif, type 1 domain-containing protein [Strongyloides ratti]
MDNSVITDDNEHINVQIFVPDLKFQKCFYVHLDEIVWDIKQKLLAALPQPLSQAFNFGLFLPPCDGRAGKFLLEDRPIQDYPFHDCVPYLELKYKKRVYRMLRLDEKSLKQLHSKSNLKKFMDYVQSKNSTKIEKFCHQGLDPNFHDINGETPLTLAAGIQDNHDVIIQLVGGGAHLDFRNSEGQTGLHKAAFLSFVSNVKTMLELGASPSYKDPIGLTPLYYSMLTTESDDRIAEMLLAEASEIGITDMHGNHEIHQACKNGLTKHVEHLLYYGANVNAQNINGNTPLHVCSVNNKPECARVLLFRGANVNILNNQGQTALHVAQLIGNQQVVDVILHYNPSIVVPYRSTPKYNTKRRIPSNTISRRRSLSQVSISSSMQSENFYRSPSTMSNFGPGSRLSSINMKNNIDDQLSNDSSSITMVPSSSPSIHSGNQIIYANNRSEYGTLKRYAPEKMLTPPPGFEANIPRILVIPRGPKGFGFILRGVKNLEENEIFEPTPLVPGLQFFEGVDMAGMAMKAGLIPGDFLLEINGIDVRRASHEQVVQMIQMVKETITLKVITIDSNMHNNHFQSLGQNSLRRSVHYGVISRPPPPPPIRHPSTSLSVARGISMQQHILPTSSMKLPNYNHINQRRISAAELENLMARRNMPVQMCTPNINNYDMSDSMSSTSEYASTGGKKFNSVADMKRKKQVRASMNNSSYESSGDGIQTNYGMPNSFNQLYFGYDSHLIHPHPQEHKDFNGYYNDNKQIKIKSSNSSPDINQQYIYDENSYNNLQNNINRVHDGGRKTSNSDFSKTYKTTIRPKTPPPPPPIINGNITDDDEAPKIPQIDYNDFDSDENDVESKIIYKSAKSTVIKGHPINKSSLEEDNKKSNKNDKSLSIPKGNIPPPPPPPPPLINLSKNTSYKKNDKECTNSSQLPSTKSIGITSTLLSNVKLNSTSSTNNNEDSKVSQIKKNGKNLDFDSDLRNALARRRQKVCVEDDEYDDNGKSCESLNNIGSLSLKESIRENVEKQQNKLSVNVMGKNNNNNNSLTQKKDSGYTSSRTSLEPSENGDDNHEKNENLKNNINSNNVSILSQQIEETCNEMSSFNIDKQFPPTININFATKTNSNITYVTSTYEYDQKPESSSSERSIEGPVKTPPVDYDEPDSGHGDSDQDDKPHILNQYKNKDLINWTIMDVCDWLTSIRMSEYAKNFQKRNIRGADLMMFDRAKFTQLGVTRIAHRQCMEQSLKSFNSNVA